MTQNRPRILLVEDDAELLLTTSELLGFCGYAVEAVSSGSRAMESFRQMPPDLVLADVNMPGVSGYQLLKYIREHDRSGRIPVIFVTGRATAGEIRDGLDEGADAYVVKPYMPQELLDLIARWIASGRKP
jgi:CheY-like chemotaxis protein